MSGRGPMIATNPQYSTSFAALIRSARFLPIGCQILQYSCSVPDLRTTSSASGRSRNFSICSGLLRSRLAE